MTPSEEKRFNEYANEIACACGATLDDVANGIRRLRDVSHLGMNFRTDEMLPAEKISISETPLAYHARVYLNNEYQQYCTAANAITGKIRRAVEYARYVFDPFGDYVFREDCIKFQSDDTPEMEVVSGDVKIFVPRIVRGPQ